ncbi:hypothetical protein [Deinococcus koreensis]|uniref:DUF4175 domain-containing protein n=1 Tax=Deinococcus koreensis TaxID=2054903 RepID=A0A2K3US41_9DEIO|nr:hypothetical protein [Deinococcus koreensis]PNY79355.1 hypothetical protein CVO96_19715 [Deinococcus koreensis]
MDAAPLPECDERLRMAARLWAAWPWLMALTLGSAPALHMLGLSGLWLVLIPALGGLLLTLVVVLPARHPRPGFTPAAGERAVPAMSRPTA